MAVKLTTSKFADEKCGVCAETQVMNLEVGIAMGTNPPGHSAHPQHQKGKNAACWVMCCCVCSHLHVFTTSVTFLYDSGACIKCKKPYIITHIRVVS